ncbi:MAG: sulfite exporter TauE/SafE family protein [Anaerolineales bacterium]
MALYLYPLGVGAGFAAGFINTLAGSGSLITLPLLIFMGLPANVANGTNRVAILLQNLVAAGGFRRLKLMDWRGALLLGLPATVGSLIGAQIAVNLAAVVMQRTIGALLIIMLILVLVRPQRWLEAKGTPFLGRPVWSWVLGFFLIGVYGGFIQVGVGIFLLAALVLGVGYNLVRANAVKVAIILFYIPFDL